MYKNIIFVFIISLLGGYSLVSCTTTCGSSTCGGTALCCTMTNSAQCYDPSAYTCNAEVLCPTSNPSACGTGCYDPNEYHCVAGQLQQGPETTAPTTAPVAPTAAPTSAPVAPTAAPTSAPVAPTAAPTSAPTQAHVTTAPTSAPTAAPTQAPTSAVTAAPSGGSQQFTCSNIYCDSGYCCLTTHPANGLSEYECYNPDEFVCTPMVMCAVGMQGCGLSCYNPQYFTCTNGQLQAS